MMHIQELVLLFMIIFSVTKEAKAIELFPGLKCTYNYDLEVHNHRGKRSTKELNFKVNVQVDAEVLNRHSLEQDAYIISLHLSHPRIIRIKNGRRIKHSVDHDLEKRLSEPFFFLQDVKGNISKVFFPHNDLPELVGLKKGIVSAFNFKIHPDSQNTSYSTEEEDDSGIHIAYYDVNKTNSNNLRLTKKWSSKDYLKHADGRPVEGKQHTEGYYYITVDIQGGTIRNTRRYHSSYLQSDKPYNRPMNIPEFQQHPDLNLKASGESHLNLLHCVNTPPIKKRAKRSVEKSQSLLENLKQDTLTYGEMQNLKWSAVGDPAQSNRTFYELLRCYSDPSVKENELSQCIKELHYFARTNDEIFNMIVNLTLERSHLNFSSWSALVGSIVSRGDYETQKTLSRIILTEEPRPLSIEEHAKILEAVYFIPSGPLYPELFQALLSLHKNSSKSDEITVRAMLVTAGLVRRSHDAGYNRTLSEFIAQHLHHSFKTHPARFHGRESQSYETYLWNHLCAFGNLGHISSLSLITRYLDHDSSGIRYFAVSALRKLPQQHTDHHLLRILRTDEQVTVKAGVIEVFLERRQNLSEELRDAIEDVLWRSEEGDELDSKITEFLENHNEKSHHVIKNLRKRRSIIRRKKRALIPALKPREFSLGVKKEWRKAFGGSKAGAEAVMRFANHVKLRIGIFGGSFEVNLDNLALFRAHALMWSFDIVHGKAAFKMGAGFKNDIPKDIIHTVADTADSFLAKVDAISSIFTEHLQKFLDKLKIYIPFIPDAFLKFISQTVEFLNRTIHASRFGKFFNRIVGNCRNVWHIHALWSKIENLVKKLSLSIDKINLSTGSLADGFGFLKKLVDLFAKLGLRLPRGLPIDFNIKKFLAHINGAFPSISYGVQDYFKGLGISYPKTFFKMFHFNATLNFIPSLNKFRIATLRLKMFGNNFLEMLSVFRDMLNFDLPGLFIKIFNHDFVKTQDFDFGLPYDWRKKFNFKITFSDPDFEKFKNLFRFLFEIFLNLDSSNFEFRQFFREILPKMRIKIEAKKLFVGADNTNIAKWFQLLITDFYNLINQFDWKMSEVSNSANFLDSLSKISNDFLDYALPNICKLQDFMVKSAGTFKEFGENIENDAIVEIRKITNEAQKTITEVKNISVFVDEFIDELKINVSSTAKTFVQQYLTTLEGSLESVEELADITAEFTAKTSAKLKGFCYKTADISGEILDKIQSEAQNAVKEISDFITSNSEGITDLIDKFKSIVTNVEEWHKQNLEKRLGKVAIISQTIDELLSLVKNDNKLFSDISKVFKNINNVIQHLNDLPTYAQKAHDFADKINDFATNGKLWETEIKKLDVRKHFKLDFDKHLQELCKEFQSFEKDITKHIQGDNLFKTFRKFVTTETDNLIMNSVEKLNIVKIPLEKASKDLEKMSNSIAEIEAVLIELRPFADNFSPVSQEISQLPNCSDIQSIFADIIKRCGKETIAFGKQTYNEYAAMKTEVEAFLELQSHVEWEGLSLHKCIKGETCLTNVYKKQAQSVLNQMKKLRKIFNNFEFLDELKICKQKVEDVSGVFAKIKNISTLIKEFSFKEEVNKIKDLSQRITGKYFGNDYKTEKKKRSALKPARIEKSIAEHIRKVEETRKMIEKLITEVISVFQKVSRDNIEPFQKKLTDVQQKFSILFQIKDKSISISSILKPLKSVLGTMIGFTETCNKVVEPFEKGILDVLRKTSDFAEIFDNKLKYYGNKVRDVSEFINNLVGKIVSFLDTIQLRQKGLDIRDYKKWNQYKHCSAEVCLRLLRRSTWLYLNTIFLWKYPHLDDLSSTTLSNTGKWLIPGLFDDYKIRSIAQLSNNEMILGMRGVSSNAQKASLLVVVDIRSSSTAILKIVQLEHDGSPFLGDMGGLVVVNNLIWMSSGYRLHGISLSKLRNSMSTKRPVTISISKTKSFNYQITSISYDDRDSKIWVLYSNSLKVQSYAMSPFGDILQEKDTLITEQHTRGFTIVRQYGIKYACVAKCSLAAGYQCRLEFHKIDGGALDESTILRAVRTPTGLEAIQTVDSENVVAAFSSGTFSERDKIKRIAGDFEDRFFKFKVPVLKTEFTITENCLFFKVALDYLIPRQRLFPFGEMKCGTRRKRSAIEKVLDKDVYTEELEKHRRVRRQAADEVTCLWSVEGKPLTGSIPVVPEISFTISVFGIPVKFFFGADLYYFGNYKISLCLRDREVRLALIPGVWLTVYAGASLPLLIIEAGITFEARLLETYLIPELTVRVDKWPLNACIQLKLQMTPLSIRVYLWFRYRLCIKISYKPWFSLSISINWCSKITFAEWTWSTRAIHHTLFNNCNQNRDTSRPGVGQCTAKQVGDRKYFIQWQGFTEDTKINIYIVMIGSIAGSGDDHYSIHGERQSLLVPDLNIMHGRSVYVGVYAMNADLLKSDVAHCPVFTAKRRSPVITFIYDGDSLDDIDYQMDTTSLAMKYGFKGTFEELSSVRWGISSSSNCSFSESEVDVLPLKTIGDTYTIKKTGLNLTSGWKYYVRVVVVNQLGLASVACSDGITIDTTPPIPRNFTVGKKGTKFIPSVRRVSGKFQHFIDNESPIVKYEWKLIDESTGNDATPSTRIALTQTSPLLYGLSLTPGKKYTAVLKGTNAVGLHAVVNVSGITPDDTIPVCEGLPSDVISFNDVIDRDFVSSLTNLTAMFSCYDDESGIKLMQAGAGTYPGGEDVHPFVDITNLPMRVSDDLKITWVSFNNISITKLSRYHVTVKVQNMVGYRKTVSSDGILVDTTEPTVLPSYIRDGLQGIDKKYSKGFDIFTAHWENAFADTESGIGEYFVGLGSSPGQDDKSTLKSNNLSTQASLSSDHLESGKTYYVTVIACNRVGMCVNGSSNGAMVDFKPPHTGVVTAGQEGPPLQITWINKAAWARWQWCPADKSELRASSNTCEPSSFYDEHSGIRRFGLTVLSYDTAKTITPVKIVGRVVTSGLHVVMPNGVFSVLVQAEDRAGGSSNGISNPFIIDTTPPKIAKLYHGMENGQISYTQIEDYVFTAFFEITEDISEIISYSVGVSTFPEGDDIIPFVEYKLSVTANIIHVNWTSVNSNILINGRKYYITVKCTNAAKLFLIASSPPLIFDNEPPLVSHVFDGWESQDSQYHLFSSIYRMHWQRVADITGIQEISVCLSSTKNEKKCNLHPKIQISTKAISHTFTNISLQSGSYCYAYLEIKDNAGNQGKFWSNGALVDTTPPNKGRVIDGQGGSDQVYQRETNILYASWSGFSENETRIHHYELAFGTSPNDSNVQPFTNVGLVTSTSSSNLLVSELKSGVVYYAQIIAYNTLGIRSEIAISNGVLVDTTPPVFPSAVSDGKAFQFDIDYSSNSTSLSINWKCYDKESGLRKVLVGLGTQPGIQDLVVDRSVLPYQSIYNFEGLNLTQGLRYFSTVKCINNVGLQSSAASDGITIDSTPPLLKYVYIGRSRYHGTTHIGQGSAIIANWKFNDFESTVTRYIVSINHLVNSTRILGPWLFNGNKTSENVHITKNDLEHNERYVISVIAFNGAGHFTTGISNGFIVDGTPPTCTNIYDVTLDGARTSFSGLTSKLAIYYNCNDSETGIIKYQFAIKDLNTSMYIFPFQSMKKKSAPLAVVDGFGKQIVKLQHGDKYQVGLRITNNVNLTSEYWTAGVTVDTTGPIFRRVTPSYSVYNDAIQVLWQLLDNESGIRILYWSLHTSPDPKYLENFTEISSNATQLLISDSSLKLGVTYYVHFKAINTAALSTLFVSNGVIVDRTPPTAGRVSADFAVPKNYDGNPNMTDGATFTVRWTGFIDPESGIKSYAWAIGLVKEEIIALGNGFFTDIQFTGSVNGYIIKDQTIHTDKIYHVCIRVLNGAGLTTTNCSDEIRVKLGKLTAGVVYDGPLTEDTDFQLDDKALWLHWAGFEDPVYGLKRYAWCYGKFAKTENDTFNCLDSISPVDPPLQISAHKFYNISLQHGQRYLVKVEAANQRDEIVSSTSDGFRVDRTAPNPGILEIGGSQGGRTIYITGISAPIVSWSMYESESALQEFHFGIGTFPNNDDIFPFAKLDGSTHSLNPDEINFNLTHGLAFYITVLGINVLGLKSTVISPQIIVDWLPPTPNIIRDGNKTSDIDFQFDVEHISASWEEFLDAESDIVEYLYCVGTRPDACNVQNQTSVGLERRAEVRAKLEHGETYFVTVAAVNSAGLSTTSSSNGVTIDTSPPIIQGFSILSVANLDQNTTKENITAVSTSQCKIQASWDSITDSVSEIKRASVCATTIEEDCNLLTWQDLNPYSLAVSIDFQKPLQSGTILILKLKGENGAGLKTVVNSHRILIDTTPPRKGFVKIGGKEDLVWLKEGQPLIASWQGFADTESGIKEYKWQICLASQISNCVTTFVSVGLKRNVVLSDIGLAHSAEYRFVVKAVNFAGIDTNSVSNSFILDKTSPEVGMVFHGHKSFEDKYYQSSSTEVSTSWTSFSDKESGISSYEVCIGSIPGLCDVSEFRNVGLATSAITGNLHLHHNATYYTTVRATNGAGQTSFASSSEIIIDLTSPIGSMLRDGEDSDEDISHHDSFISINWDEAHDSESGISKYVVCAGTVIGACDLVSPTTVSNSFAAKLNVDPAISSGTVVYSTLWAYNNAGTSTEIYSDGVLVDSTPPETGKVEITSLSTPQGKARYLTSKESLCATWSTFNDTETAIVSYHFSLCSKMNEKSCPISRRNLNNKTSICIEEPAVTEGVEYFVEITATNEVGLSSTSKSTHFVVDTSEPDVGQVFASNPLGGKYDFISSVVFASWNGFLDKESGISEYLICIGKEPGLCNLADSVSVGKTLQYFWYNLSLVSTEEYFVSIRSVNNAGLFTDYIASDPFTVDTTAPLPGAVFDGSESGEDVVYQQNPDQVSACWFKVEDPQSDITALSWCIGSAPGSCDQMPNTQIDINATKMSAFLQEPAENGKRFYITLTAVNGAGLNTTMMSDGVTIDYTPPVAGKVVVGEDSEVDYITNGDTIYAHFLGFADTVSGIKSYQFALCEKSNISSCPMEFTNIGLQTNITLSGLELENGKGYVIIVRASDFVGLTVDETSNEFIADETSPVLGWISVVSPSPTNFDMTKITSKWGSFYDPESEVVHYEICLGKAQGECDEINYLSVALNTTYTFNGLELRHEEEYYVTIKAINVVGFSTQSTSNGIKIDLTPPEPVKHMSGSSSDSGGVCYSLFDNCDEKIPDSEERKVEVSCESDVLKATWQEHEDKESGIALTEWCIETVNNTCNVQSWDTVAPNTLTVSAIIHSPLTIIQVRAVVRITNGVGNYVLLKSTQCNPEQTFPPLINVSVIHELNETTPVSVYQTNRDVIIVTWSLPENKSWYSRVQAALAIYDQNSIKTTLDTWHGETLVFDFVDIFGEKSYIIFSGSRLQPYIKYRPIVRLCNTFDLCSDSTGDPVIIIPDAPPDLQINATDTIEGTEQNRWQKYVGIPPMTREIFEETLFLSDPLSVLINANLRHTNETTLFSKHVPITYNASIHRVTSGANETRNVTIDSREIFNNSHLYNDVNVCCSKRNKESRFVNSDRQFKPIAETNLFGITVSAVGKHSVVASSKDTVYMFSTESLHVTPIRNVMVNTSSNHSYVKVKAKNNTVLVSVSGSLLLYKQGDTNLTSSSQFLYITNCNHTRTDEPEHCSDDNQWSSVGSVGQVFEYDGKDIIAVSGIDHEGFSVIAIFKNDNNTWRLNQVLGHEGNNVPYSIAINEQFMVIAGSKVRVYTKGLDSFWQLENTLPISPQNVVSAKTVHLTKRNELFILTKRATTFKVFELGAPSAKATKKCKYVFPKNIKLSGALDVLEDSILIAAIGIKSNGRDGAELISYDSEDGCVRIGGVLSKSGSPFDSSDAIASVAITEKYLIIGTPGKLTWPTKYVNVGTGGLYVTTFCKRNHIRKKVLGDNQKEHVICVPCRLNEKAYPGFEDQCTDCTNSICLHNSTDARFKVSHCDTYPCTVSKNRTIGQNISRDNLTVTEWTQNYEGEEFYLPGSSQSYFIRLTQRLATGTTTTSDSFPFSIDYTSPEAGSVFDGLGSDESRNCSTNTTFSSEHQCTSRSFSETDLDYTYNTTEISARWLDFRDDESNIAHYFWCIGSTPLNDDIMSCENATNSLNRSLTGLSLQHNDKYYVTVLVCNYAGLCTAKSSDGVLVDTTPPIIHYVRDGLVGPDIDFQVFTNVIFGNWEAEDPESGVVSYEIGWGSEPGQDDVWEFQEIGNASRWYAKFGSGDLEIGGKFYVTVRAINAAGLESEPMTSNGITVGKTEFVFSKNDSGSFFFDTVNIDANETKEEEEVGHTFGTVDVPAGAVEDNVKFQMYSLGEKELKNGTDDSTNVVDPEVVKPPKHFKLGDYSFQIKAYEPENNTLQSNYRFKKPITITLVYDVEQMLKINKKVVSDDVTKDDIDPVLLLWDTKNQTWFDAAKTCPEPWTHVDKQAKLIKVKVCHLTQFALFWTFEAENGLFEFHKETNGTTSKPPPHGLVGEDNNVIYNPERYGDKMFFDVVRYKGSTGEINLTWAVTIQPGTPPSFAVTPKSGKLRFHEGQWNSSIQLRFPFIPDTEKKIAIFVKLIDVSGGAMLGNFTTVKIIFPQNVSDDEVTTPIKNNNNESNIILEVLLPSLGGALLIILGIMVAIIFSRRARIRKERVIRSSTHRDNPTYGFSQTDQTHSGLQQSETSFTDKDPPY